MRVHVHPYFDPYYYGFYWEGLRRLGAEITLGCDGFPPPDDDGFYAPKDTFAMLVETSQGTNRVYISADDHGDVAESALTWADRFGTVNLDPANAHVFDERVLALGPSFGVRAWSPVEAAHTCWEARRTTPEPLRGRRRDKMFIDQYRKRLPEATYDRGRSEPDFVFFTAWPWTKHPDVNPPRARFIEACHRSPGLDFEGGFAPRRRDNPAEFDGLYAPKRYPLVEYMQLIRRSALAFSNPAVHGCVGWKLGEFLALGKAIVTVPIDNVLPEPLEHGVNVHIVDGSAEELDAAIQRIRADHVYREQLETNARAYYDRWLRPEVVAARLIGDRDE